MKRIQVTVWLVLSLLLALPVSATDVTGVLRNGATVLANGYTIWDLQGCSNPRMTTGGVPPRRFRVGADGSGNLASSIVSTDRVVCGSGEAPYFQVRAYDADGVLRWTRLYQTPGTTFDFATAVVYVGGGRPGLPSNVTNDGTSTKFGGPVGIGTTPQTGSALTIDGAIALKSGVLNAQTGTSYTLLASDNGKVLTFNNASDITLTVPAGLGAGFSCLVVQLGAGTVTPTADSTTISQRESLTKTAGANAIATLMAVAADTFILSGDLQ